MMLRYIALKRLFLRSQNLIYGFLGFVMVLVAWDLLTRTGLVDPFFISSPGRTWNALLDEVGRGTMMKDLAATAGSFGAGLAIAIVIGVPLALLTAWFKYIEYVVDPFFWFLYNVPKLAFYPLFIIWLGLGTPTIVALTALFAVFPIFANTFTGVREVNPLFLIAARSFGAHQWQLFARVVLPAAAPVILAGVRLGIGRGMVGVIIAEMFGATAGLGFRMNYSASLLRTSEYFAPLVVVVALGLLIDQLLRVVERKVGRWNQT